MKKNYFFGMAILAAIGFASPSFAQTEAMRPDQKIKTKSNIKNDRVCIVQITPTDSGCDIVFNHEVSSPRDAASGLATGKRQHKPFRFTVSSSDNSVMEVQAPRDVATGQSSGRRSAGTPIGGIIVKGGKNPGGAQFNKIVVEEDGTFALPENCPDGEYGMVLSWSWGASNGKSAKRGTAAFNLTIENGVCIAIKEQGVK